MPTDEDLDLVRFTREEALSAADREWPGAEFPEARLARFTLSATEPPLECLCWVVVVDSPGDPPYLGTPAQPGSNQAVAGAVAGEWFRIAVFDAETGEYYFTIEKVIEFAD